MAAAMIEMVVVTVLLLAMVNDVVVLLVVVMEVPATGFMTVKRLSKEHNRGCRRPSAQLYTAPGFRQHRAG